MNDVVDDTYRDIVDLAHPIYPLEDTVYTEDYHYVHSLPDRNMLLLTICQSSWCLKESRGRTLGLRHMTGL